MKMPESILQSSARYAPNCTGAFNYLAQSAQSSLYRNGKVLMRRDLDGNDDAMQGVDNDRRQAKVQNGRIGDQLPSLDQNGFELLKKSLPDPALDFFDQHDVIHDYYPECVRIVEAATGGNAFAFDHNVRSPREKERQRRISGGQSVQEPIHHVHGDYTLFSAPQRLRDLSKPPSGNDTLRGALPEGQSLISQELLAQALSASGRFAFINVWRNIGSEPVAKDPLALCDARSVNPEDLVVFEIHYPERIGENYFAKHSDRHRWYYFPAMTRDEPLLIKQWDSAGPLASTDGSTGDAGDPQAPCSFSFHTAFDGPPEPAAAPDRQSIEVRCVVIFD